MVEKSKYVYIGEGVLRGFFLTLGLILLFAIVSCFVDISESARSMCLLIISMLSIVYGSIYSTKKIRRKGWIVGLIVSLIYMLIFFIISILSKNSISSLNIYKVLLGVVVGVLSGMLGINMQ